ncbi:MAG: hypothetical protein N5P05_003622 [Chroococcopsis gigantea SAG 12.99]|jgi:hypothetical protein|nr:hypothetical protein [Chroococcopsis gigantea SAG 12.99]
MSTIVTGYVERKELAGGAWALKSDAGKTYELMNPPADLTATKDKVKVTGNIRGDVMTIAMIGPVLEVIAFEKLG